MLLVQIGLLVVAVRYLSRMAGGPNPAVDSRTMTKLMDFAVGVVIVAAVVGVAVSWAAGFVVLLAAGAALFLYARRQRSSL